MSGNRKISHSEIDSFRKNLEKLKSLSCDNEREVPVATTKKTKIVAPASARNAETKFDAEALLALGQNVEKTKAEIFERAEKERKKLEIDWPGNPRLCNESLLGPLGLRSNELPKEVPLTNALAWLITPQREGSPLHAYLLAATLELILALEHSISPAAVLDWKVSAEHLIENDDGDRGRIDIYAIGEVESKHYQVAIEAKVGALEGRNQLEKYEQYMQTRTKQIQERGGGRTFVIFLTQSGRLSRSSKKAISISYANLLKKWLPVLEVHRSAPAAAFARLLCADIARDLADMHIGDQLSGKHGELPRYVGEATMKSHKGTDHE